MLWEDGGKRSSISFIGVSVLAQVNTLTNIVIFNIFLCFFVISPIDIN